MAEYSKYIVTLINGKRISVVAKGIQYAKSKETGELIAITFTDVKNKDWKLIFLNPKAVAMIEMGDMDAEYL